MSSTVSSPEADEPVGPAGDRAAPHDAEEPVHDALGERADRVRQPVGPEDQGERPDDDGEDDGADHGSGRQERVLTALDAEKQ